ncbi:MAG: hypothetical protein AAF823_08715 [Planctomycetota bacterium]
MDTTATDQFSTIVNEFESRLAELRDAQQQLIRQLETDKVVLQVQMDERAAQLERERAEMHAERRRVEAERRELDRVWAVVRELADVMGKSSSALKLAEPATQDTPAEANVEANVEAQPSTDHDGWDIRHAA